MLLFGRADARRVPHFEPDGDRVRTVLRHPGLHGDLALFGELYGVAEEVREDLADTTGAALERARHFVLDEADYLQALLVGARRASP